MAHNKNPMPPSVYQFMIRFYPKGTRESHDLHHAIFDRGLVKGMPLEVQKLIHDPMNLLWIPSRIHASHLQVPSRVEAYKMLCERWGKEAEDVYITDMLSKFKSAPFTLESLQQ